jgi:hypothetical protein
MKVKIGPYKRWFGPYQLANALCFWVKDQPDERGCMDKPDWVHHFGDWLAFGKKCDISQYPHDLPKTRLYRLLLWVEQKRQRKVSVRVDDYDAWNVDSTLALIIHPTLLKLRQVKQGSPIVDDEDVPEHLRSTSATPLTEDQKNCGEVDEFFHKRWEWVLDEMIFAFSTKVSDNWDDECWSGESDFYFKEQEDKSGYTLEKGPKHTRTYDKDKMTKIRARIDNGFRLFGRYYQNLWS